MLETSGGKISEQDLRTTRGFSSDFLRNIANRQVDGIRSIVPKQGELCFV